MTGSGVPLFVDLDGTLLAADSLWLSLALLLKSDPLGAIRAPFWLSQGKARFKRRVALRVVPDPEALPYDRDVVSFLRQEKSLGREIVLATAADARIAERVAAHLGVFSAILASDGEVNLAGARKLEAIVRYAAGREFDYIGDAPVDLCLFRASRQAMLVRPKESLLKAVSAVARVGRVFSPRGFPRLVEKTR
jgi:phosphoserine phosphatase